VLEILDTNGHRLATCNDPFDDKPPSGVPIAKDATPNGFDDPCMNNGTTDKVNVAWLDFKVPGTTGDVTFCVHVFDWRGFARPDMYYDLSIAQKPCIGSLFHQDTAIRTQRPSDRCRLPPRLTALLSRLIFNRMSCLYPTNSVQEQHIS
jgi:hypothetical protein